MIVIWERQRCSVEECDSAPGTRPTNVISIELEIRSNFGVLWFKICFTDQKKNLHTSRQYTCHDLYNISLWSVAYIPNQNTGNFWEISLKGDGRYVIILLWNDCMPHFCFIRNR